MAFNTSDEDIKKQVEDIIKCHICLENLRDPRMLPCSHTYCLKCMKDLASNNHGQFQCPLRDGRKIASADIDSLPINRHVRDIAEALSKYEGKKTN